MKRPLLFMAAIAVLVPALMGTRPYLDISGPNFRPLPLAIVDVSPATKGEEDVKLAREITSVIKNDLEISGLFKILDPKSFVTKPEAEGFEESAIKWQEWADVGAEGLIKGRVSADKAGAQSVALRLFSVSSSNQELDKSYPLTGQDARQAAHRFAGEVVKFFTGEKGIFGTKLVFVRKQSGAETINMVDMDGSNERVLVSNGSINLLPSWSPDGQTILYTSFINHNPDLYEYNIKARLSKVVSNHPGLNIGANVSPDGSQIALTLSRDDNSEVYLISRDGKIIKRLTEDWGIDSSVTWSPDGKRLAFVSTRSGNPHIYIMNTDGTDQKRLTFKGNYNQTPKWSPRGDRIAFTARDERNVFDLFLVDPATGEITRLTQDQGNNEEPSWSPNGRHLVFTSTRSGSSQIYIMNADGSNQRRITSGKGECATPAWGPYSSEKE
ncbi:MAG: Tol-Pal system beta propeller repeat protein TolB [Myxococcota bacterium]|jgi:TolB protein